MEGFRGPSEGREAPGPWHVVERFSESSNRERGNEDAAVVTDECIAVLDGVSARGSKERMYNLTPGQFAVRVGSEILRARGTSSLNVVERMTHALREAVDGHSLPHPPSFVCAAFFPQEHVIVRVGDCSYLIDGVGSNPGLNVDHAKAVIRKRTIERLRAKGYTDEALVQYRSSVEQKRRDEELRLWQEHYSNNPAAPDFGYGVINGSSVPERFIERVAVSVDAQEIVLATDGYPPEALRGTLAESESALRALQLSDPIGIQGNPAIRPHQPMPGATASDDRTYIRIVR